MIARGRLRKCDICGYTDFQEDVCRSGIIQPYDDDGWATDPKERDLCPKCTKELNHVWENYIKKNGLKRRFKEMCRERPVYQMHDMIELTIDPFVPVCFGTEHIKTHSLFSGDPIKKVIYNAPNAVIVFWTDGTKTVVKCSKNDTWDPEKGLAMAIAKKFLGNKGNYNNILKKHLTEETK